jgi:hypothetical protein
VNQQQRGSELVDFTRLAGRLRIAAGVLAVAAVAGSVIDGLLHGLTFSLLIRWATGFVAATLVVTAVLGAVYAVRGATGAQRRGQRLSGGDTGFLPPRRPWRR